jgi:esterase/lipase
MIISGKNDAANAWSKYAQKLYLFLNKIFKSVQLIILNDSRHEVFTDIQKDISYNHLKEFITR